MGEPVTAKGVNGTISFDGRIVTISRGGILGRLTIGKGEKRIPVKSITGVEWKPPGMGVRGFISFTLPGAIEDRSKFGTRTVDATRDENAVLFSKTQMGEFEAVRNAIEDAL